MAIHIHDEGGGELPNIGIISRWRTPRPGDQIEINTAGGNNTSAF